MVPSAPWLAHYDDGVPASLEPYPDRTLIDYLADAARAHPAHPALLFKGARVSYGELQRLSDVFAAALQSLGVKPGHRVALVLPNCPQFFIAEFGAWKAGAIVAPLNPTYTEYELEGPLRDHGIETVVTLTRFYERIKAVQRRTGVRRVIATNIKEYFPPALRLLFTLFRERRDGDRVQVRPGDHDFAYLLLINRRRRPAPVAGLTPRDPAVVLMSGGTTGIPKGVLGTHAAYVHAGLQVKAWNASALRGPDDVLFLPLPLFHVYANVGVQALGIINGSTIALIPNPRDLNDLVATLGRVKPTFFNGVPTLYNALLNHPDVRSGKVDFTSIRLCFSGASALLAETKARFESLTGARIVEGYSLTESMLALCVNPVKGANKLGSVGMPVPDVQVRIFDAEGGTRTPGPNEIGEVAMTAPQLMLGYLNRPDETSLALRDHGGDGAGRWLHTGDLGYLDEDGYLFIVDRMKDLIKTSGYQVWPREIEEVLAAHPAIAEVGVAGIPDQAKGEAVKAWAVLRAGQSVSEEQLRAFCREKLAPYKVPSKIEFRTELPKTMVGKVLRRALRESVE
jgi:long-chain acyl-CoA synthetase